MLTIGSTLPLIDIPDLAASISRSRFSNCRCIKSLNLSEGSQLLQSDASAFSTSATESLVGPPNFEFRGYAVLSRSLVRTATSSPIVESWRGPSKRMHHPQRLTAISF
jgi:hypothetical protein